jgi:alpha-L-fucosidase
MNRRTFIDRIIGASATVPFWQGAALAYTPPAGGPERRLAAPTPEAAAWQDLEIGMFIHFAPNTWQDLEGDDLSTPLSAINPAQLDTDQWVECALGLGAKYIVFVAKHVGGFCMWQTQTTDYGIRNAPWRDGKGDVMADLSHSCRKRGLKLGIYLSPRDDRFGASTGARCKTPALQSAYDSLYRRQLTELLTRYGEMVEIWFDGSLATPVGDILKQHAPHAMIFQGPFATIRWVGNEDGFAPYPTWTAVPESDARSGVATAMHSDPNGSVWLPIEADVSIRRPDWFWSTKNERNVLSVEQLLEIYYRSVGHGTQLLVNIPADRRGLLPQADALRAREFGDEIRQRFGQSVAETHGAGESLILTLPSPTRIDHVILQENCSTGQRVRAYSLEARAQGNWQPLGTGTAIGHKRIQPVTPSVVEAVRLMITKSVGQPAILRLALFNTVSTPPSTWDALPRIWAEDEAGKWTKHAFRVELSPKITAAGQYRLRCVPQVWGDVAIENPQLLLDGVVRPELLRQVSGSPDVLILTIPGTGHKAIIKGRVQGAEQGTLLFHKM